MDAVVDAANSSLPGGGGVDDAYRDPQRVREVSQRFGQAASASAKVVGAKFQVKPFPQVRKQDFFGDKTFLKATL